MVDQWTEPRFTHFEEILKMESIFNPENKNGIIDEEKFQELVSSSSSTTFESSETDLFEEVNSSDQYANGPLQNMSSLLQQLPIKRGLSEHYNGKSRSFTSLSNVRCLEDLAKPENPYNKNKKLKSCKSDRRILEGYYRCRRPSRSNIASRIIPKKTSRSGSCGRRNSRPPLPPPHRSTSFTNQTPFVYLKDLWVD